MYSTHNKEKFVVAEIFIRTLKNKIYKYMASIPKNEYIGKFNDIINKYNDTYNSKIKMKPVDLKSSTYIKTNKEINDKDPKFKIGDIVRISKDQNIFSKGYVPNWSEEVFVINKVKNTVSWHVLVVIVKAKQVKQKGYNSSFNSWIDNKDILEMNEYFP